MLPLRTRDPSLPNALTHEHLPEGGRLDAAVLFDLLLDVRCSGNGLGRDAFRPNLGDVLPMPIHVAGQELGECCTAGLRLLQAMVVPSIHALGFEGRVLCGLALGSAPAPASFAPTPSAMRPGAR